MFNSIHLLLVGVFLPPLACSACTSFQPSKLPSPSPFDSNYVFPSSGNTTIVSSVVTCNGTQDCIFASKAGVVSNYTILYPASWGGIVHQPYTLSIRNQQTAQSLRTSSSSSVTP